MSHHWTIAFIAAVALSAPLAAQHVSQDTTARTVIPTVAFEPVSAPVAARDYGPALSSPRTNAPTDHAVRSVSSSDSETSRNPAMMIVGGAALLVGAVVGGKGGTTIMVGGGVLGLVGLWNYLK